MAENKVRHVLHRRSNVTIPKNVQIERSCTNTIQSPKAPTDDQIEYGEIAVNFAKGSEALFIKNSENEVIQVNSLQNIRFDGNIDPNLNKYLDSRYVNRSGDSIYGTISISAQTPDECSEAYGDDPKFFYVGSEVGVSATTTNVSGKSLNVTESATTVNVSDTLTNNVGKEFKTVVSSENGSLFDMSGCEVTLKGCEITESASTVLNLFGATINLSGDTTNVVINPYTKVQYPTKGDVTYPIGHENVETDDNLQSAFNKVETTISALTQEVLDDEYVIAKAIDEIDLSVGLDRNLKYAVQGTCYIDSAQTQSVTGALAIHDAILCGEVVKRSGDTMYGGLIINGSTEHPDFKVDVRDAFIDADREIKLKTDGGSLVDMKDCTITISGCNLNETFTNDYNIVTPHINFTTSGANKSTLDMNGCEVKLSGCTLTEDFSQSISAKTPQFTLSATTELDLLGDKVLISGETTDIRIKPYTKVEYPTKDDETYLEGYQNVETDDNLQTAFNKVETTISALTQEVLDDEYVIAKAIDQIDLSVGLDRNLKYAVQGTCYIDSAQTQSVTGALAIHDNIICAETVKRSGDTMYGGLEINGSAEHPDFVVKARNISESATTNFDIKAGNTINEAAPNINLSATTEINLKTNGGAYFDMNGCTITESACTVNQEASTAYNVKAPKYHFGTNNDASVIDMNGCEVNISGCNITEKATTTITLSATTSINETAATITESATTLNLTGATTANLKGATVNISGTTNISGNTTVGGTTVLKSTLNVNGATDLDSTLNVDGASTLQSTLNVSGATKVGNTISATSSISTADKFIGKLDKTLSFSEGTFSAKSFNNTADVNVLVPTDLSHLTANNLPSTTTALDCRYVQRAGDTMWGALKIANGSSCSSVGTTKITLNTDGTSSFGGNMTVEGTISASSAIYSSDARLKENVTNIYNGDAYKASQVELKAYNFKADENKTQKYGVIAQDLEAVGLNHLVTTAEDGTKGVDYISFLILKIQQLENEINELKRQK